VYRVSKLIDLTGQKFYEWTVLRKGESTKAGKTRWVCQCSCGKEGLVTGYDLKAGKHKSCGHDRDRGVQDLAGKVFGELKALEYIGGSQWRCVCTCGEEVIAKSYGLTTGRTTSCGHSYENRFIDLKGKVFGEWRVLEYVGDHMWKCQCSCGTVSNIHSYSLRKGGSLSCGCSIESKLLEDLTGQRFGDWTAHRYVKEKAVWECRCSCGKTGYVAAYDLKRGNSKNCGHDRKTPYIDRTGMKYGELTVLRYTTNGRYECKCSCGTVKEIARGSLGNGSTISCGCKQFTEYTEEYLREVIQKYTEETGEAPFSNDIAEVLGITYYYVNQLVNKYGIRDLLNNKFASRFEKDIYQFIKGLDPEIVIKNRNRGILGNGKELDIYVPSKRLAIEFNGDYWHTEDRVGKLYHQQKTIEAAKKGIQLIHIFEHEWINKDTRRKIEELLRAKIEPKNMVRIQARKCEVREVGIGEERNFLDRYHLQGYSNSKIAYGLYYSDELVALMTFGKPRFRGTVEWELIRYCNKDGVAITGGAEKLFKKFIGTSEAKEVLSYCDIAKFNGLVYKKLGFKATAKDITEPNYKWLKYSDKEVKILSRYQTQKQRLLDAGLGEHGNTEDEIMESLGYLKVCDSGNLRFMWSSAVM